MSKPENKETAAKPNTAAADCSGASNAGGAAVSIIINKAYITSISGILKIVEFVRTICDYDALILSFG